jgi:hypothetical protein
MRCQSMLGLGGTVIMFQSLAHTDDIINCIAEPTVKLNDTMVGSPNLQIDFGTPGLSE